nr:feruloyl CoA ortho-hydroxylase 1-like [Ipomoea batatas]
MDVVSDDSIPVIDVSNWEDPKVAKLICDAVENRSFFQIVNHEISLEMLEKAKAATYRFFKEPVEEKKKYSKENSATSHVSGSILVVDPRWWATLVVVRLGLEEEADGHCAIERNTA